MQTAVERHAAPTDHACERFNAWGTVIAVLLLGTGKTGLILVGAEPWAQSMFSGVVLLSALALTNFERTLAARTLDPGATEAPRPAQSRRRSLRNRN